MTILKIQENLKYFNKVFPLQRDVYRLLSIVSEFFKHNGYRGFHDGVRRVFTRLKLIFYFSVGTELLLLQYDKRNSYWKCFKGAWKISQAVNACYSLLKPKTKTKAIETKRWFKIAFSMAGKVAKLVVLYRCFMTEGRHSLRAKLGFGWKGLRGVVGITCLWIKVRGGPKKVKLLKKVLGAADSAYNIEKHAYKAFKILLTSARISAFLGR